MSMSALLREPAVLRASRALPETSGSSGGAGSDGAGSAGNCGASSGGASNICDGCAYSLFLFMMHDDVMLLVLEQLRLSRDVPSLLSCLACSRLLACLTRQVLRQHFPLFELLPELLALPAHLQSHVSERCKVHLSAGRLPGGLLRDGLYAAVQRLLQGELPPDVEWLVVQQWSSTLEQELHATAEAHRRWRIGYVGMPPGRYYRLGGLDDKGASEHWFRFRGEEASVADFFAEKRQQPLRRPQLPCILAGPRSNPGLIRLPLELLRCEKPSRTPTTLTHTHARTHPPKGDCHGCVPVRSEFVQVSLIQPVYFNEQHAA